MKNKRKGARAQGHRGAKKNSKAMGDVPLLRFVTLKGECQKASIYTISSDVSREFVDGLGEHIRGPERKLKIESHHRLVEHVNTRDERRMAPPSPPWRRSSAPSPCSAADGFAADRRLQAIVLPGHGLVLGHHRRTAARYGSYCSPKRRLRLGSSYQTTKA